jgi:hypothetical protein
MQVEAKITRHAEGIAKEVGENYNLKWNREKQIETTPSKWA